MKKVVGLIFVIAFLGGCDQTEPESTVDEPTVDIWTAAEEGDIDAIRQHVISGTDINETYIWFGNPCSGGTPLHFAVIGGQMEAAKLLLEKGANINPMADDEHGGTPLHWAAALGRVDFVKFLVEAGADVNAKDDNGYTPLDATCHVAIADLLHQHGGKRRGDHMKTVAVTTIDIWTAVAHGNIEAVKQHLNGGTDIDGTFVKAGTPGSGGTPLHVAVLAGQMEAAKLLLEQGANINAKADDEHGGTPLHWGAATGRKDLATLLIDAGANVNAVDNNGYTPLDATNYKAEQAGARKHEIAEHLKEHGGKTRSGRNSTFVVPALDIWTAAADGNIDAIRLHVMAGTDINETFKGYLT